MYKPFVLVVEDEENIQQTLSVVLTLMGYRTYTATNVEEALKVLAEERIDAVSLDIKMPDPAGLERDGLTLLKHLRTAPGYGHLPVLLFTGADLKPEEETEIAGLGAKVFRKPQSYERIINELRRVLPPPTAGPASEPAPES